MSSSPSKLCKRCARVLEFNDSAFGVKCGSKEKGYFLGSRFEQVPRDGTSDHEFLDSLPELPVLSSSARDGCCFCAILITAITECGFPEQYILVSFRLCFSLGGHRQEGKWYYSNLRALVACISLVKDRNTSYLRFDIDGPPGKCEEWLRLESTPEQAALSQNNVQWLRRNLFEENISFQADKEAYIAPYRPLRLIDVNPVGIYDCRLVVTDKESVSPHSYYLALSYCWGSPEDARTQFKTKRKTVNDRCRGFLLESTPQCIRDAIQVSRALGIRYIWVDSLCILQDDEKDWEMQSAQMAQIYHNAIAVICVAASKSCHQGFLERSENPVRIRFQSQIDPKICGQLNIGYRGKIPYSRHGNYGNWFLDTNHCEWSTRGWTYQELYLAQRAIIFGPRKIHYVQSSILWSENQQRISNGMNVPLNKSLIAAGDSTYTSGWLDAIFEFAKRRFSDILDRLPAISGLAEIVSGGCPDHYVAGIRKSYMHRDLIWAVGHDAGVLPAAMGKIWIILSLQSPDPYIAPSWSWASRSEGICLPSAVQAHMFGEQKLESFREEYSKLDAHVLVIGYNPYGRISQGSLKVSAVVIPLWSTLKMNIPFWTGFEPGEREDSRRNLRHHTDDKFSARVWLDWRPSGKNEPADDLWFFLLGSCHQQGNSHKLRDWPSSSESEDLSHFTNSSVAVGSTEFRFVDILGTEENDVGGSTVLGEVDEPVEKAAATVSNDIEYNSQFSGSERLESGKGMNLIPTEKGDYRNEASSETQTESNQKASTSGLITAPTSAREPEDRATREDFDNPFEPETSPELGQSEVKGDEGRIAYGLIIHPAGDSGKFFRVGIWTSHDLGFFRGRQESTFELI